MTLMGFATVIFVVMAILGIVFVCCGLNETGDSLFVEIGIFLVIAGLCLLVMFSVTDSALNTAQAIKMAKNGTEVYIDGQCIDHTKINWESYYVTIEDDYIILNHGR